MKKILCLVIAIILMLTCVGCGSEDYEYTIDSDSRFYIVEVGIDETITKAIFVDRETKVMYLRWGNGITVMLDADGNPLLWEG